MQKLAVILNDDVVVVVHDVQGDEHILLTGVCKAQKMYDKVKANWT